MGSINEKAVEKLESEFKAAKKLTSKGNVVASPVLNALKQFCEQNEEFAQAVVQSDKLFTDCVEATVKGVGNACSDFEVYRKAAEFYFEGATIHFKMVIDLGDGGFSNKENAPLLSHSDKRSSGLSLSLDDLLM